MIKWPFELLQTQNIPYNVNVFLFPQVSKEKVAHLEFCANVPVMWLLCC